VGLPGHFVVRHEPAEGEPQLIDVYERGQVVPKEEAERRVREAMQRPPTEADFGTASKRAIIVRMLHNLLGLAQRSQDAEGMLRYLDAIIAVSPDAGPERFVRSKLLLFSGRRSEAIADTDWLLEHRPEGVNLNEVDEFRRVLNRAE
jgi:regulator of sirC expression with transglutaminase-like and TPR domain